MPTNPAPTTAAAAMRRKSRAVDFFGPLFATTTSGELGWVGMRRCALGAKPGQLDEVAAIVKSDPGLAAKVLQLVNSAYFGAGQTTSSIQHAVRLLGLERIRSITMVFDGAAHPTSEVAALQAHAVATATLASKLVPEHADQAFSAGLLHDVGHVVLIGHAESGLDHVEVGACLLGVWGLPAPLVQIVRHHHTPETAPLEQRLIATAVHVADTSSHGRAIDRDLVERCGYLDRLAEWTAVADGSRLR